MEDSAFFFVCQTNGSLKSTVFLPRSILNFFYKLNLFRVRFKQKENTFRVVLNLLQ